MRFLMVLLPFLIPFAVHAQSGVSTSYIRMTPTALPSKCRLGDLRVDTASNALQLCSPANTWAPFTTTASGVAISIGNLDGYSPSSQGQSLNSNILYAQSASASNPGLVNTTSQTFAGQKNFPTPPSIGIGTLSPSLPLLLDGSNNVTSGKVNLATQTTGSLGVATGGTGQSSLTAHSVIVGNGTSGVTQVGPGTSNYVLAGAGASADPSFATISSILDSIGSAQGDLLYRGSSGWSVLAPGTGGYVLSTNGAGANPSWISVSGVGTVTSVGLSVPAFLSVTNSPVTGAGTLAVTFSGTAIPVANGGTGGTSAASAVNNLVVAPTAVKTNTYSILTTDATVLVSGASNAFTATLPTAVGVSGKIYTVKRTDSTIANLVTLGTTSSQTIDGATTRNLSTQYEQFTVISDGSNWQILSHTYPAGYSSALSFTISSGFGTVTQSVIKSRRVGDSLQVVGSFTAGTSSAASFSIGLPLTMDSTKLNTNGNLQAVGTWTQETSSAYPNYSSGGSGRAFYDGSSNTTVFFTGASVSNAFVKQNVSDNLNPGASFTFEFTVPISGWEG